MGGRVRGRLPHVGLAAVVVVILAGCTASVAIAPSTSSSGLAPSSSATSTPAGGSLSTASSGVTVITRAGSLRDAALALIHERRPSACVKETHVEPDPGAVAAVLEKAQTSGPFANGLGWVGSMNEAAVGLGGTEVLVSAQAGTPVWLVGTSAVAGAVAAVPAGSLVAIELKPYQLMSDLTAWLATGNAEAGDICSS